MVALAADAHRVIACFRLERMSAQIRRRRYAFWRVLETPGFGME